MAGLPARPRAFAPILTDTNFDKLEKLREFSSEHGHTIGELAISWLLSHSWLSSVIAGATNPGQVSANVAAANWRLTEEEKAELD
jgi:aryl-alcohol dehydrogenase-like predicted oxidoreductase